MGRPAPAQDVTLDVVPSYGPEPIGAAQTRSLDRQYLRDAAGISNPRSIHRGIKGDPARTVFADLGPIQGDGSQILTRRIKSTQRPGFGAALPNTAGGSAPSSIQDQLGALGI